MVRLRQGAVQMHWYARCCLLQQCPERGGRPGEYGGSLGEPEATLRFDDSLEGSRQDTVITGVVYYSDGVQTKSTGTKALRTEPRGNQVGVSSFPFSVESHAQINPPPHAPATCDVRQRRPTLANQGSSQPWCLGCFGALAPACLTLLLTLQPPRPNGALATLRSSQALAGF